MKKAFILFSALSLSTLLSACGDHMSHADNGMDHSDGAAKHEEHKRMMTEYYFNRMDTNHDGVVTMKEFMDFQRKEFKAADTNHDGELTIDEVMAQEKREHDKMWQWKREHHDDMQQHSYMHDSSNNMRDNGMQSDDMQQPYNGMRAPNDTMQYNNSDTMNQSNQ